MSFLSVPRAQDASETMRQRMRAIFEVAAVILVAGIAVCLLLAKHSADLPLQELGSLAALSLIVGALSWSQYRSRMSAYLNARAWREQQERFTTVIEGTGVGLWESVIGENQIYLSDGWSQMLGLVRDSRLPMQVDEWRNLVHPDDIGNVDRVIAECSATSGHVFQLDYRLRHVGGHWIWVVSRGTVNERAADGRALRAVGTQSDITSRKMAEFAMKESERKFRSLFERLPVGIALADYRSKRFLQVNDAFLKPGGFSREEVLQMDYDQLAVRTDGGSLNQPTGQREREFRRKDGSRYPVLISGVRMTDSSGRDVVWSVVQDISHSKIVERELAIAARSDRLTGLANRTLFMERLQESVERVRSKAQTMFAVLFLDFDRFKVVNDAMGHQAGDELLVLIAERLRNALRSSDTNPAAESRNQIARFGGDEFLVLINDVECADDAAHIADRLLTALSNPYSIQGREVHSTASIGIVTSEQSMEGAETIIRNADVAMYEAKRAGRACSVFFNDAMHTRLSRNLMIETSLRQALGTDQLTLVYQAIVELDTGKRSSVEALLRWNHPTLGPVSPSEFVPVAEESGLIAQLGEWVMRESCAALARWQALDPQKAPRVVSVNVSRAELAQGPRLLKSIRAALDASGLTPDCLQLEVTEREVMRDPAASLALMNQLRQVGVRLAMDDFGTGTSSLGCLRDYPFDVIKIDRSFVSGLAAGPDTLAVIHATITLVENLGKCSVAEGVETAEQLAILQSLGCHYAQGYFLGYPLAEADVVETERTITAPRLRMVR
jgi:diguanylate cyclase (GGDEF)-like protein/PAS domain S-box-containing protein